MADTGYLQMTIAGSAGGQAINNVLFYGQEDGTEAVWTDSLLLAFLTEWGENFLDTWLDAMPDDYTLQSLVARVVDTRGVVLSDNAVSLAVALPGTRVQDINGPFQCAIIRLPTVRAVAMGARAMKRSYIAFGPLGNTTLTADGALVLVAANYIGAVAAALGTILTVGTEDYYPVRIGRTVAPAVPAIGIVTTPAVDPYGSFRKSRKRRANGS